MSYAEFLTEKLGVPMDIKPIAKQILEVVMKVAKDHLSKLAAADNVYEPFHSNVKVNGPSSFPLNGVELISMSMMLDDDSPKEIFVNGEFAGLFMGPLGLMIRMKILPTVKRSALRDPKILSKVRLDAEGAIMHELTHAFESYQRMVTHRSRGIDLTADSKFDSVAMSFDRIVRQEIPTSLRDLFFIIYLAASYEINARVAQIEPYLRKKKTNDSKLAAIKETEMWRNAQQLLNFDAKKKYDELIKDIGNEDEVEKTIELYTALVSDLAKKSSFTFVLGSDVPVSFDDRTDMANFFNSHAAKDIAKMARKDAKQFLQFWEKRAHARGEELRRKLLRAIAL